jgi:hypothetical protein
VALNLDSLVGGLALGISAISMPPISSHRASLRCESELISIPSIVSIAAGAPQRSSQTSGTTRQSEYKASTPKRAPRISLSTCSRALTSSNTTAPENSATNDANSQSARLSHAFEYSSRLDLPCGQVTADGELTLS